MLRSSSLLLAAIPLLACSDDGGTGGAATTAATSATGVVSAGSGSSRSATTAVTAGSGATQSSSGSGTSDPCAGTLFCETFEDYAGVSDIANDDTFGPWRAAVNANGGSMSLDGTHAISGSRALRVRIEGGTEAGGRLFASGDLPLFAGNPTHVYGRMMMYVDPNGTSIHWTYFGASGNADDGSPAAGRRATYLMSSLPRNQVNTHSFVYGLAPEGNDPFHDCWFQSQEAMPTAGWQCVAFEMDSVARKLRMTLDGAAAPQVSVDDTGQGCVGDVPGDSLWYGPMLDEIYVGAWSFHPMDGPLEVWIDDLVLDDAPLACP